MKIKISTIICLILILSLWGLFHGDLSFFYKYTAVVINKDTRPTWKRNSGIDHVLKLRDISDNIKFSIHPSPETYQSISIGDTLRKESFSIYYKISKRLYNDSISITNTPTDPLFNTNSNLLTNDKQNKRK